MCSTVATAPIGCPVRTMPTCCPAGPVPTPKPVARATTSSTPARVPTEWTAVRGDDTAYATKAATVQIERTVTVQVADLSKNILIEGFTGVHRAGPGRPRPAAASPTGQRMLASLDQGLVDGDTLTIREFSENNGHAWADVSAAQGMQRAIDYNPAFNTFLGDTPPVVVLYHEMAHQYDFVNGTMLAGPHTDPAYPDQTSLPDGKWQPVPNAERQAVGLPVDHDHNPSTPSRIDPSHPLPFTENGLRSELTWAQRARYAE